MSSTQLLSQKQKPSLPDKAKQPTRQCLKRQSDAKKPPPASLEDAPSDNKKNEVGQENKEPMKSGGASAFKKVLAKARATRQSSDADKIEEEEKATDAKKIINNAAAEASGQESENS